MENTNKYINKSLLKDQNVGFLINETDKVIDDVQSILNSWDYSKLKNIHRADELLDMEIWLKKTIIRIKDNNNISAKLNPEWGDALIYGVVLLYDIIKNIIDEDIYLINDRIKKINTLILILRKIEREEI